MIKEIRDIHCHSCHAYSEKGFYIPKGTVELVLCPNCLIEAAHYYFDYQYFKNRSDKFWRLKNDKRSRRNE